MEVKGGILASFLISEGTLSVFRHRGWCSQWVQNLCFYRCSEFLLLSVHGSNGRLQQKTSTTYSQLPNESELLVLVPGPFWPLSLGCLCSVPKRGCTYLPAACLWNGAPRGAGHLLSPQTSPLTLSFILSRPQEASSELWVFPPPEAEQEAAAG